MIIRFLRTCFLTYSPVLFYTVSGNSMHPSYKAGDVVFARRFFFQAPCVEDVVIALHPLTKRLLIKRIKRIEKGKYFLTGDNAHESTDSRIFGKIERKFIIAKVLS